MLRGRALLQRHARGFFTWAPSEAFLSSWTKNQTLREWVTDRINLFQVRRDFSFWFRPKRLNGLWMTAGEGAPVRWE